MNEFVQLPRRVIPRWRDFATTAALGELGSLKSSRTPENPRADLALAKDNWVAFKSPLSAGELLTAALIEKDWPALTEAAQYLSGEDVVASEFIKDIARHALEWAIAKNPFLEPELSATHTPVFNPSIIGSIRRILSNFSNSPIHWVELALGYSIIGRPEKARRAILTALHLAPNDRFVLRCATRLFLHQDDPDLALDVLNGSSRTPSDSWLLSAHLSVAAILGKDSKFHKQARRTFDSLSISPFHLSELGSALATTELAGGNSQKAKKLFRRALLDPTENALAQALWAKNKIAIEQQNNLLKLPRSFEANARFLIQAEKWNQATTATQAWQTDEPFSSRPAGLGSFLAITAQEDFKKAIQIVHTGLIANPGDPTLINNLVYAYACSGRIEDARKVLTQYPCKDCPPEQEIALLATAGLIEYRAGNTLEARAKYNEAMELAKVLKLQSYYIRAKIHYAREELRADPSKSQQAVLEALSLGKKDNDPIVKLTLSKLNEDLEKAGIPIASKILKVTPTLKQHTVNQSLLKRGDS